MKERNNWLGRLIALLIVSFTLTTLVALAAGTGSADDPLVSLSYLNDVYTAELMKKVDAKIAARNTALSEKLAAQIAAGGGSSIGKTDAAATFVLVTLSKGQTLQMGLGCEAMLRVGTGSCTAASAPGLIDSTDATTLASGGALVKNHLYMATVEERGVKATAETTKLLVRGTYTIG